MISTWTMGGVGVCDTCFGVTSLVTSSLLRNDAALDEWGVCEASLSLSLRLDSVRLDSAIEMRLSLFSTSECCFSLVSCLILLFSKKSKIRI